MTKVSLSLQELRRKIYGKAKTEKHYTEFDGEMLETGYG
jgi:hypothetical protein